MKSYMSDIEEETEKEKQDRLFELKRLESKFD